MFLQNAQKHESSFFRNVMHKTAASSDLWCVPGYHLIEWTLRLHWDVKKRMFGLVASNQQQYKDKLCTQRTPVRSDVFNTTTNTCGFFLNQNASQRFCSCFTCCGGNRFSCTVLYNELCFHCHHDDRIKIKSHIYTELFATEVGVLSITSGFK